MSDPLSKSISDVLALQEENRKALDENGHHPLTKPFLGDLSEIAQQEADRKAHGPPTVEDLGKKVPYRIWVSRQLLRSYLSTASNRSKILKSIEKPLQTLLDYYQAAIGENIQVTPMAVEHYLGLISDILLHCDNTEVFDRAFLERSIQELSKYVVNPEFEDGIEASSEETSAPPFTRA